MFIRPKIFFPKKSYSMLGEDLIIKKFFKDKISGFYVDVGCYHPIEGSNTYLLYKKRWNGINIDVNQFSINLFNMARKDDLNINLAISNKKKKVKLYYRKKINMLNTTKKEIAKIYFQKGFNKRIVNANTLNSVLRKSKYKNRKIDFLNIDVEGEELNVLRSLNFNQYKPKLICIEIHNQEDTNNQHAHYLQKNLIYKFLIKKKYEIIWHKEFSFIFKKK